MSKENEWEDDPDMQEFLEWADQPGPWDEEDDKIHTVGGLTNDKKNGFMSFVNKTQMSKEEFKLTVKLTSEQLKQADIIEKYLLDKHIDIYRRTKRTHIKEWLVNQNKDE